MRDLINPLAFSELARVNPLALSALAALTLAASVWLYVDVRWSGGSLVDDPPHTPFGPLTGALPRRWNRPGLRRRGRGQR